MVLRHGHRPCRKILEKDAQKTAAQQTAEKEQMQEKLNESCRLHSRPPTARMADTVLDVLKLTEMNLFKHLLDDINDEVQNTRP